MSARPLVSLIVPTIGRATLPRLLASVRGQAPARDVELLVVGDTHADTWAEALAAVPAWCRQYRARYVTHDGGEHCVGQPQRNYGATVARGRWLMYSQDDARWRPDAWGAIRDALQRGAQYPHLFRVRTRFGYVVWNQQGDLQEGFIDADCIAVPNDPARLGTWTMRYAGDLDFIRETVALWEHRVYWEPPIIADSRPATEAGS